MLVLKKPKYLTFYTSEWAIQASDPAKFLTKIYKIYNEIS
jgi:hypothetical protein